MLKIQAVLHMLDMLEAVYVKLTTAVARTLVVDLSLTGVSKLDLLMPG